MNILLEEKPEFKYTILAMIVSLCGLFIYNLYHIMQFIIQSEEFKGNILLMMAISLVPMLLALGLFFLNTIAKIIVQLLL